MVINGNFSCQIMFQNKKIETWLLAGGRAYNYKIKDTLKILLVRKNSNIST